jgi:hypothetical protein
LFVGETVTIGVQVLDGTEVVVNNNATTTGFKGGSVWVT